MLDQPLLPCGVSYWHMSCYFETDLLRLFNSPSAHLEWFSPLHLGSKMTQTQSIISSLIIHVHKNWFHNLLAKCLPYENRKRFIAKHAVMMSLFYIIYNHYQPEIHGGHSTAARRRPAYLSKSYSLISRLRLPTTHQVCTRHASKCKMSMCNCNEQCNADDDTESWQL